MKRQKVTIGSFIKIPIKENIHSYGRILPSDLIAFYDCFTDKDLSPEEIAKSKVLFLLCVHIYAITRGRWLKVGNLPVTESNLLVKQEFFRQDPINKSDLSIIGYDGKIRKATRDECINLERWSVWDYHIIEWILLDYYEGRPSYDYESSKVDSWKLEYSKMESFKLREERLKKFQEEIGELKPQRRNLGDKGTIESSFGDIYVIPLRDGFHTYARLIDRVKYEFYDCFTDQEMTVEEISKCRVLLTVFAYSYSGWPKIGKLPLSEVKPSSSLFYIQSPFDPTERYLKQENGELTPLTIEESQNYERNHHWPRELIEKRLQDYFDNRKEPEEKMPIFNWEC